MCGVVGLVYEKNNGQLGREGAALLRKLEYRGYDSTGGAFFKKDGSLVLKKKVGAPSRVVQELEIEKLAGCKFIGQVRWATYGAVDDINAQPHQVSCLRQLVGAHNGNISNTDTLKEFLSENGHDVVSDNDGEMLTHLVEHFYSRELDRAAKPGPERRQAALRAALRQASLKVQGAYAACFSLPDGEGIFAVKAGSSLYAGKGRDTAGDFILVSSDLTSVLSKTRYLIPLAEGEAIYFTSRDYVVFDLASGEERQRALKRSKLNIADIALQPKYHFFMEQEIFSTPTNLAEILQYYFQRPGEQNCFDVFERHEAECQHIIFEMLKLYAIFERPALRRAFVKICEDVRLRTIVDEIARLPQASWRPDSATAFASEEAQLLGELRELGAAFRLPLAVLDLMVIWKKKRRVLLFKLQALERFRRCRDRGNKIFLVGAGSSYHAALCAAAFFDRLARCPVIPCNPGLFRSLYLDGLRAGDTLLLISQSGETKDLIDVIGQVRQRGLSDVALLALVNNENSTIPQEKADFFLPILCGPEIAVAATKSFTNQLAVLYLLAAGLVENEAALAQRLEQIRYLLEVTLRSVEEEVSEVALKIFLKPSLHILGTSLTGLAREGALKIREVVLNHTEGYDAAEFKHGPNTILGKNTIYSLRDLENVLADCADFFKEAISGDAGGRPGMEELGRFLEWVRDFRFRDFKTEVIQRPGSAPTWRERWYRLFKERVQIEKYFSRYPLIFLCPPDERDKRITITQIHTHKIRGADIILLAEEDDELRKAVEGRPAGSVDYFCKYIRIPKSGDRDLFTFQATAVLQLLALRMSVAKMKYLNRMHVENHGVHPDVPKNVSKSITVD